MRSSTVCVTEHAKTDLTERELQTCLSINRGVTDTKQDETEEKAAEMTSLLIYNTKIFITDLSRLAWGSNSGTQKLGPVLVNIWSLAISQFTSCGFNVSRVL